MTVHLYQSHLERCDLQASEQKDIRCEMLRRQLSTTTRQFSHENPLGLPRKGSPPTLPRMQRGLPEKRSIPSVRKVIAVSSAKGGVGKSTIAANLALALARQGNRTGILDTDIFGPSIPTLFNLTDAEEPRLSANNQLVPITNYGVKTMSMGYLVGKDSPIVWRGLMVMKALQQLLHEVEWGGLDVLVLDMPPGTGDTQLTITQQIIVDGAVLVSTPQKLALADTLRGLGMFGKVNVPVLGMVSNMAVHTCRHCGEQSDIFGGRKGIEDACTEHQVDFLGHVPLDSGINADADAGRPSVIRDVEGPVGQMFLRLAQAIGKKIDL